MTNVAKQLFGETNKKKIHATGGFVFNIELIKEKFESPDAFAKMFCSGCGITLELNEQQTKKICEKANFKIPNEKFFFHSQGCEVCDGSESF